MTTAQAITELEGRTPQIPRIKIQEVASDFLDFHIKLTLGAIAMPCWLEIGKVSYNVTRENYESLAKGILIGMEVRNHFTAMTAQAGK